MRILTCCYEYPPVGGGGGMVVQGLTDELARSGHSVDLVTMHYKTLSLYEHRGRVVLYRVPGIRRRKYICTSLEMFFYIIRAIPVVLRLVKKNRYDINHTHFIFPDGIIAWIVYKLTGLPYIITAHGSDVPKHNKRRFSLLHLILSPIWRKVVRSAQVVVCPSVTLEHLVINTEPNLTTKIIPNGFSAAKFAQRFPKKNRIITVTRIFEGKGIQYLFEALKELDIGETEIHVVGEGPYLATLRRIASEHNLAVVFHGYMDNTSEAFKELLETSRIFVFPSEAENFPTVLLEAMACAAAIITTKDTGCEEVVCDTAVLVKAGDVSGIRSAIKGLLADKRKCEQLGKAARNRLETQFAWPVITAEYLRQYSAIPHKQSVPS